MVRNFKKLPPELKKAARAAFSKFSVQTVQALQTEGLQVTFCRAELDEAGGRFNPQNKTIEIFVQPGDKHTEAYLIHEMVHSVDHLRHKNETSTPTRLLTPQSDRFASRQDPELRDLHLQYAKKSLPGVGREIADFLKSHPELKGKTVKAGGREYNWKMDGKSLRLDEKNRALRGLEATSAPLTLGVVTTALGAAAMAVAAAAGSVLTGGLIGVPLVVFGAKHLASAATALRDERALVGYEDSGVQVDASGMTLPLDAPTSSESEPTTVYASLSRRPEEYLAESMTEYLRSPETRKSLEERDPDMYSYCEAWNLAPEKI